MIEIKNRWSGAVIFSHEGPSVLDGVKAAIAAGVSLYAANLTAANLTAANLTRADLTAANLTDANLTRADLTAANLTAANLTAVRDDLFSVLDAASNEVAALLAKLREGGVNGQVYEGECACLVGTIANARGVRYDKMTDLRPSSRRPAERFFLSIGRGSTPSNNPFAKHVEAWILEWQAKRAEVTP